MSAYQKDLLLKDIKQINVESQISTPYFLFGYRANREDYQIETWNPDDKDLVNGHFLICGLSGSGKTTLLKQMIRYLNRRRKHIFVIDMQGDMIIKDWVQKENGKLEYEKVGNYIELTAWGSKYGIPAFEFDTGVSMEELTKYANGATPDETTMKILKSSGPKVQVENLLEIIQRHYLPHIGQEQKNTFYDLFSDTYKLKGFKFDDYTTWTNTDLPHFGTTLELIGLIEEYIKHNEKKEELIELFNGKGIDIEKYTSNARIKTVSKLESYIKSLHDSSIFHSNPMPIKSGLNVIDISGLNHKIQRVIADIILGKVFKACKIRGEYKQRPAEKRTRGDKCDTFVIIDEASLITGGKNKNDPWGYSERIAKESRKYGLSIGVAAQSSSHFPIEFLRNFATQIILNTNKSDFDNARKNFAVDKEMLNFTHQKGGALVKVNNQFVKVKLPIFDEEEMIFHERRNKN